MLPLAHEFSTPEVYSTWITFILQYLYRLKKSFKNFTREVSPNKPPEQSGLG